MPKDTLADVSDDTLLVLYANGDAEAARTQRPRHQPQGQSARRLGIAVGIQH